MVHTYNATAVAACAHYALAATQLRAVSNSIYIYNQSYSSHLSLLRRICICICVHHLCHFADKQDALYGEYGEGAPRGKGPDQNILQAKGNVYLTEKYPNLSYIISAKRI
jgi:hypothetical protein